jgi:hypothetical protein
MGFLFGDILAVTAADIAMIYAGGRRGAGAARPDLAAASRRRR